MAIASKKAVEEFTLVLSKEEFSALKDLVGERLYSEPWLSIWSAVEEVSE